MARTKLTQQQLKEIKKRAKPVEYGSVSVDEYGNLVEVKSDFDKRIIRGYGVIWGQRNLFGEIFVKGAFAKSIRERGPGSSAPYKIKFLNNHEDCEALSLFAVLKEDDIGLFFETVPLDDVQWADDAITQLRSGTLNNFSIGWNFVWDKIEWDDVTDSIVILEAELYEISVVAIPADMATYCMRALNGEEQVELFDQTESFINQLPKKDRLQARRLFTQTRSLINSEAETKPLSQGSEALGTEVAELDYEYLINNL